ncbi:MAG: hypothetical protein Q8916_12710 [Bacteroidota bacterium]|nr:hypothetical protein [Bacteroidota bacterium]MDP4231254.1 hypothetical protein [Bacteroidota bacterium]MDP4236513.1 hypothetical protein [Bacteroidota bacterium]
MRNKSIGILIIAAAFVIVLASIQGCSPNATNPFTELKTGELNATVSGIGSFYATNAYADSSGITYHVHASMLDTNKVDSLVVDLLVLRKTPVPYTEDVTSDINNIITFCIVNQNGCNTYTARQGNGNSSGTIKITSISPTLQGTFSGTVVLVGGSETRTITNGEFNAAYN